MTAEFGGYLIYFSTIVHWWLGQRFAVCPGRLQLSLEADLTYLSRLTQLTAAAVLAATVLTLAGCGDAQPEDLTADWSAEQLYREARRTLLDGGANVAVEYYEKLEARYPYGKYTQQARLDLGYAYFQNGQPDAAIEAADRFIKLYPLHPAVDYAYYLKGLVNFRREVSIFERFMPQDLAERQTTTSRRAFEDFLVLLRLFPESRYAEDARQRMVFLRNQLARHEMAVADYYLRRGAYVAVASRAKYILEHYPNTPQTPGALALLVKSYRLLGMQQLAQDSLRILHANYPDHPATQSAQNFTVVN